MENSECTISVEEEKILIFASGNEISLNFDKIRSVDFQMDIDEKQFLKSSLVKGVVGAATFGVAGAIIGSSPKEKVKREVIGYTIISYNNSLGEFKQFALKDKIPNSLKCAKLTDTLKPRVKHNANKIEL